MGAAKRKKGRKRGSSISTPPADSAPPASGDAKRRVTADASSALEAPPGTQAAQAETPPADAVKASAVPEEPGVFGRGGDPSVKPRGPALWALNLFIGGLFFLFTVDALPNSIPGIGRLDGAINTVADKLGLAQGDWKLFSPDPDHINAYIEATITFSDGSTQTWTTTNWRDRSLLDKFLQGRHPKFSDAFRMDRNKFIWPYLTDYILTQVTPPQGTKVTQVELFRHWWEVPLPKDFAAEAKKYKHMPPHREEYPNEFSFYTKKY